MRHLIVPALMLAATALPLAAQGTARFAPSGRGTSTVELMRPEGDPDTTTKVIRLDWGQPHLRGRTLHTDSLVPLGQVWRAGANGTTTLHTDFMVMFGNHHLPAGRYALFTLPAQDGWQLILQRDIGQTIADYDAGKDVALVPMRHRAMATPVEGLTMLLIPATSGLRGELRILWGAHELTTEWSAM